MLNKFRAIAIAVMALTLGACASGVNAPSSYTNFEFGGNQEGDVYIRTNRQGEPSVNVRYCPPDWGEVKFGCVRQDALRFLDGILGN